jgi:hypothetical protein
MNLSHEYMNVWHEANDYLSNQFSINAGIMLEQDKPVGNATGRSGIGIGREMWKVLNRKNEVLWTGEIGRDGWQNFAVTVNYLNK